MATLACSLIAAEMGGWALHRGGYPLFDFIQMKRGMPARVDRPDPAAELADIRLAAVHAGGAVFFGLAAANVVPGGALIGVALYIIYSLGIRQAMSKEYHYFGCVAVEYLTNQLFTAIPLVKQQHDANPPPIPAIWIAVAVQIMLGGIFLLANRSNA